METIENAKPQEKLKFTVNHLQNHIASMIEKINKLNDELQQTKGILNYLRQVESVFKFDGQE